MDATPRSAATPAPADGSPRAGVPHPAVPTTPGAGGGAVAPDGHFDLTDRPTGGRAYDLAVRVRFGDVTPGGRLRLDALARYLQDVANDDAVDAIGDDAAAWVVRRTTLLVHRLPGWRTDLTLTTWGAGVGARWAERRTSVRDEHGACVEASSLWVHVDLATGRPKRLPASFDAAYGEAAQGRKVQARTAHPDQPPPEATEAAWDVRFSDLDVIGHVNNAVYLAMAEQHAPGLRPALDATAAPGHEGPYRGARPGGPGNAPGGEPAETTAAPAGSAGGAGPVWFTVEYRTGLAPSGAATVTANGVNGWVHGADGLAATWAFTIGAPACRQPG